MLHTQLKQGGASASVGPQATTRIRRARPAVQATMFGTISRGCPMLRGLTPAATPLSARPLVTRAAASGGQGPDQTQSDRPRAGPLALALSTGLGLFLGAALGPAGPDALALGPGPAAAQEQSTSAGPVLQPVAVAPADVAGTPAGLLDRLGLSPAPAPAPGRGEEPLQKKEVNPLTMQIPEAPADLAPEELRAIRLYARNTPSVVNVTNVRQVAVQNGYWGSMDLQKIPAGFGSGFIWDDKGHIATNYHVIQGAAEVKVTLIDQSTYTAKVVGGDADKDVAVLELQGVPPEKLRQLQPVTLGSSAALLVGQRVFAIGNPLGLEHTLTSGIVSGLNRELSTGTVTIKGLVQTDAAINPGNSGGVLLDSGGRVIGINTAIADPTGKGASSGVGFALPIDTVKGLVDQILTYGRVLRPVLGITLAPPQVLKQLGQPGVLVLEVPKGSPAAAAGLKPTKRDPFSGNLVLGDIITAIDGKPVKNYSDLVGVLDDKRVGDTVQVQILRSQTDNLFESGAARRMAVSVTLGERGMVNATGAE